MDSRFSIGIVALLIFRMNIFDQEQFIVPCFSSAKFRFSRELVLDQIQERLYHQLSTPKQTNIFFPEQNSSISLIDAK